MLDQVHLTKHSFKQQSWANMVVVSTARQLTSTESHKQLASRLTANIERRTNRRAFRHYLVRFLEIHNADTILYPAVSEDQYFFK